MRVKVVLILILFSIPFSMHAQYIFQNLRWQDGLSAKEVRCLNKDPDGFLWIGTSNGMNRFDGAVIRQFKNGENNTSLYINAICPIPFTDSFLIGTRFGVKIFDKHTGVFSDNIEFKGLKKEIISSIKSDNKNRLWIASGSGIWVYEKGKLMTVAQCIPAAKAITNVGFTIAAFEWDETRKGFWIGGAGVYFVDCKNNVVYSKDHNPHRYPILDSNTVYSIALDNENGLWFGCNAKPSVNHWNAKTNKVETYIDLDGKTMKDNGPNRIFVDSHDRVWISTWMFASYLKEPGKEIKKIPFSQTQTYSIGYGFFRDAIEDAEGNVWLATINGVSKSQVENPFRAIYQLPSFDFFLETGFAQANYITVDNDLIVACKEEGIIFYNTVDRSYTRYAVSKTDYDKNPFYMAAKNGSTWWFAGANGIYYLKEGENVLKRFEKISKQEVNMGSNLIFASKGKVWFQIIHDGLYRYDPKTETIDHYDGKDARHGKFDLKSIQSFLNLNNNTILFGMNGKGYLKFDEATERFSTLAWFKIPEFTAAAMEIDQQGYIWAAVAGRGILKMDINGKYVDSINTSTGLLTDQISSLGIDRRGYIWAGCREGLMFFDPKTKNPTKVEIDLGQTLQDYWNNLIVANGKVYAIMLDHVVVIDPMKFSSNQVRKAPNLTSVNVFGEQLTEYITDNTIDLSPKQDYITFQFASLYHREIPSLQYSYQLVGVDKDWVNSGRALKVSYNNLQPGDYVFKVRSTDEKGEWMKEITSLKIHVRPNWWQTWWVVSFFALLGILLLILTYKNYIRVRQKKNIERTIDYFANSVYGENSVNEICWDIARNCISQLDFEDCVVYLLDEEKNKLIQRAAFGPKNPKGQDIIDPMEITKGKGIVGLVWETGKPLISNDLANDPRYIVDDERRNSEISVPIFHDGRVIGVIDSEHPRKNFFTDSHLRALTTIASISANKIAEAKAQSMAKINEIKLLEINKMLAESQLMALRAQMNPHFVFNCLNSIQECIVTEKYGEASKYLNKFSKLFRTVLNNSGKKLVTILEEKEVLELYMELEQMRFEQSFSYDLIIDDELEIDEILLPSMLLQPYVENALWHGLMHKIGDRKLRIEFKHVSEELFRCTIDDNGIGRKYSYELKEQQSKAKRHESKGLKISKDRLTLLERQGYHASIKILDNYDENNNATGTTVIIELSTFLKNI